MLFKVDVKNSQKQAGLTKGGLQCLQWCTVLFFFFNHYRLHFCGLKKVDMHIQSHSISFNYVFVALRLLQRSRSPFFFVRLCKKSMRFSFSSSQMFFFQWPSPWLPRYTFPRAMSALAKDPYARAALVTMACALAAASGRADMGWNSSFHWKWWFVV